MALRVDELKVRRRMLDVGIRTVEELAERADMTAVTVRRLFKGYAFGSDTLDRLAGALKCHPYDLLNDEGYPSPHLGTPAFAARQ